jgi:hypothetical protein
LLYALQILTFSHLTIQIIVNDDVKVLVLTTG